MTLEQVKAMTDDEIRIKVSELLEWKNIRVDRAYFDHYDDTGLVATNEVGYTLPLPDYPQDLNACHDMEKTLMDYEADTYIEWLNKMWCDFRATARQRCEAFILTREEVRKKGKTNDT